MFQDRNIVVKFHLSNPGGLEVTRNKLQKRGDPKKFCIYSFIHFRSAEHCVVYSSRVYIWWEHLVNVYGNEVCLCVIDTYPISSFHNYVS